MAGAGGNLFDEIGRAARSIDAFSVFRVSLAGHELEIRIESEDLSAQLKPAFEHLETSQRDRQADLTITAFDRPPPEPLSATHWLSAQNHQTSQSVRAMDERGMLYIDSLTGIVSLLDAQSSQAGVWFGPDARVPIWIAAAPFLRVLDAFYIRNGKLLCHGAAIAKNERAVLIIGPGGAGKSTLAIRACCSGFDYLGDDYVLLHPSAGSPTNVFSIYRSGKLARADLASAPIAGLDIQQEAEDPTEKSYFLPNPESIRLLAPLAAIVQPQRRLIDEPRLLQCPASHAIRAAIPSVLSQLQGCEQRKVEILTRAFDVPCYQLHLSFDHRKNIAVLDRILGENALAATTDI
jgi:hypothetical protein